MAWVDHAAWNSHGRMLALTVTTARRLGDKSSQLFLLNTQTGVLTSIKLDSFYINGFAWVGSTDDLLVTRYIEGFPSFIVVSSSDSSTLLIKPEINIGIDLYNEKGNNFLLTSEYICSTYDCRSSYVCNKWKHRGYT